MICREVNDRLTRTGPGTAAGAVHRRCWQPAALSVALDGPRPVVPVRLPDAKLVLFRDETGGLA